MLGMQTIFAWLSQICGCDYAPFNWTQTGEEHGYAISTGGYAGGYDVEIAKKIAESMDKKLEIVKTEWNGLTPALTSPRF